MSLNFDYTQVEGFDQMDENERVTGDSLVWATMAVGINHISKENAQEFFTRVSAVEMLSGAYRHSSTGPAPGPLYFTPEDVLRFVGLRTNASVLTKAKFLNRLWDGHVTMSKKSVFNI